MSPQFIEYELDDHIKILVQAAQDFEPRRAIKAAAESENVTCSVRTFQEAMEPVHLAALWMQEKLHDLATDEVELKFGLLTSGELGNFAIGKVGVEANYEVTLKWKKKPDDDLHQKMQAIRARWLRRKIHRG